MNSNNSDYTQKTQSCYTCMCTELQQCKWKEKPWHVMLVNHKKISWVKIAPVAHVKMSV